MSIFSMAHQYIRCLIMACVVLFTAWHSVSAGEAGKILLINSNMSVEKYALAQSTFKPEADVSIVTIDLGNPWMNKNSVKEAIHKEDADVIYCIGSRAYTLARQVAKNTPVIFSSVLKWQRLPLHMHTFGIDVELPAAMQLMTYHYLFPEIQRLGVLYTGSESKDWIRQAIEAAKPLHIRLIAQRLDDPSDLISGLKKLLPQVDALWLTPDPGVLSSQEAIHAIFQESDARKIPVFAYSDVFIHFGAMLAVSADTTTMGGQASVLAGDILAGHMPEQKVQFPAGSQITLHMGRLEHYGVQIREGAMQSVNKVVR